MEYSFDYERFQAALTGQYPNLTTQDGQLVFAAGQEAQELANGKSHTADIFDLVTTSSARFQETISASPVSSDEIAKTYFALRGLYLHALAVETAETTEDGALPSADKIASADAALSRLENAYRTAAEDSFIRLTTISAPVAATLPAAARFSSAQRQQFPTDPLERVLYNARAIGRVADHPVRVEDIVDISRGEDGSIVIAAKDYMPEQTKPTFATTWGAYKIGVDMGGKAGHFLNNPFEGAEPEKEVNSVGFLWGARIIANSKSRYIIRGLENLDPHQQYEFAPTHGSDHEFGIMMMVLANHGVGFLAKDFFKKLPGIGAGMAASPRFVFTGRKSEERVAVQRAILNLLNDTDSFSNITYPQGTRASGRKGPDGMPMDGDLFDPKKAKRWGETAAWVSILSTLGGKNIPYAPITVNGISAQKPSGPHKGTTLGGDVEIIIDKPINIQPYLDLGIDAKTAAKALQDEGKLVYRANYKAPLTPAPAGSVEARAIAEGKTIYQILQENPDVYGVRQAYLNSFKAPFEWLQAENMDAIATWGAQQGLNREQAIGLVHHNWNVATVDERAAVAAFQPPVKEAQGLRATLARMVETRVSSRPVQALDAGAAMVAGQQPAEIRTGLFSRMVSGALQLVDGIAKKLGAGTPVKRHVLDQLINDNVYTPAEQYKLAPIYLKEALKVGGAYVKAAFTKWTGGYKPVLEGKVTSDAPLEKAEALSRDEVIRRLEVASQVNLDEILAEIDPQLVETYGHDAATLEAARAFARDYYQYVYQEDNTALLELMKKDVPLDRSAVDAQAKVVISAFAALKDGDRVLTGMEQAAIRDLDDASRIAFSAYDDANAAVAAAEVELDNLIKAGPNEGEDAASFELRVQQARRNVADAIDAFAQAQGLGADSRTYRYLDRNILNLTGPVLKYALVRAGIVNDYLTGIVTRQDQAKAVYASLQDQIKRAEKSKAPNVADLRKQLGKVKEDLIAIAGESRKQLRNFMDVPGQARTLQAGLIEYHALYDLLTHDLSEAESKERHDLFSDLVLQSYNEGEAEGLVAQYFEAYRNWDLAGVDRMDQLQKEEALNRIEDKLLKSPQGTAVLKNAAEHVRGLAARASGVDAALDAHHAYFQQRRTWASAEKARKQELQPERVDYLATAEAKMIEFARREAVLIADAAKAMRNTLGDALTGWRAHKAHDGLDAHTRGISGVAKEATRRTEHWDRVRKPETLTPENARNGHSIGLNRSLETMHSGAGIAYDNVARARQQATGQPRPKVNSLTATALHAKVASTTNLADHRAVARSTIGNYFTNFIIPIERMGTWLSRSGLPARVTNPLLQKWSRDIGTRFHHFVADVRDLEALPGSKVQTDGAHNGGWFADYPFDITRSGHLVAKPDLVEKFPAPMKNGVMILGHLLPDEGDQDILDAEIAHAGLYGFTSPIGYETHGAQDMLLYGAATMGVVRRPDVAKLVAPGEVFTNQGVTGTDMYGFGRGTRVTTARTALEGTVARTRAHVTTVNGGHEAGPKPDKPYQVRPTTLEQTLDEVDVLATPDGLTSNAASNNPFTHRQAGEVDTLMLRRYATAASQARRLDLSAVDVDAAPSADSRSTGTASRGRHVVSRSGQAYHVVARSLGVRANVMARVGA